ncbi:MAG: bifunctional serine/threonine-protein kinase/formylglycine-generating enzyme family protein, partial [Planctomycetota bacterium]
MRRPDDDQLFDDPRDDDFSAAASATPPEISLLRDYLQLAAVADEPELQQALVQAQQFGAYLAAVLQAQSREIPQDEDGDNSTKPDRRLNSQADGHSYGQLDRQADADIPNRLGDFDIFERVDAGGMGAVYRARERSTGRVVAVKIIAPQRTENVEAQRRFRREGNLTLGLRHPHLVEVFDAGEQSGRAYLAMEYLAGRNLRDIAATQAPMAVADACELIRQAALGVDFLARRGFVHRDIKPSNLMLAGKPAKVKVLDLGLACDPGETARSELTQSQQILGTYDYLAPEQARDARAVDGRADVYSLGCTLYRLLAGFAPFARSGGGSLASILVAHQLYTAKALDSLRSDIPAPLADIVARAMRKLPSDRFATAGDFAEALAVYSVGARLDRFVEPWTNAPPPDTLTIADESNATKSTDANAFATDELDKDLPAVVSVDQRTPRIGAVATTAIGGAALLAISLLAYTVFGPVRQRWRQADESPQVATKGAERRSDQQPTAVQSSRQSPAHSPQHPPANSSQNSPALSPQKSSPPPPLCEPFPAIAAHESQRSWARYLGWEHIEVINSIGMPLRLVPPGDFAGRPLDRDARVQQPVLLGVREITEREYERIMGSGGASNSGASKSSESKPSELRDEWPARGIAWHEAIEFCRRLSDLPEERRAGRCYSLPTNALWEWACRAGCDSDMPWNDATLRDHAVANESAPRRVGSFPGNSFGLVDMRGNVAEWTADWIPESGMTGASSRV